MLLWCVGRDHAGGNLELKKAYPNVQIVGGTGDGVDGATLELGTGDSVHVGDAFKAHVFQCPCHTRGHIIFKCVASTTRCWSQ